MMSNLLRRQLVSRTGIGAAVLALTAVTGYGIGQARSPHATAAAAPAPQLALAQAGAPASYSKVVDAVTPAVVTVRVEKRATVRPAQFQGDDDLLRRFFGRESPGPREQRTPRMAGLGSGVITTADGYILTNNHVIDGADQVRVELTDKRVFDAKVVGKDAASDLAVLKVDATDLPSIAIGDSNRVRVGDIVLAVGNPLGVGQTVTMGIISAKGRATGAGDSSYEDFLQTDAPINQGNSGGALVNLSGELVGINSQILSQSGGNIGLGFAIPSNMAREVMTQLKADGQVHRGKLGVTVQSVTPDLAASLELADTSGALVSDVQADSPAARAGLRQGDVITAINGEKMADSNALRNRIAATKPGSTVDLKVVRDGKTEAVHATLGTLAPAGDRNARDDQESAGTGFGPTGMAVEPLTPQIARELGLTARKEGVVVRDVDPDGVAADAGLQPGDVISQVNRQAVKTPAELKAAIAASGERPALLLVTRKNADIFLALHNRKP